MATIYMRIEGVNKFKGAATIGEIGGKKGFFAIDSFSWGAVRGVEVDVGNANNADQGMVALSEVNISRMSDGASSFLTSFLYSPGPEGKTVEIMLTKPSRTGDGAEPYLIITLENARMANYNMSCSAGSLPSESFSLTYTTISKTYYVEGEGGKIEKSETVKYDTTTAKLVSKSKAAA